MPSGQRQMLRSDFNKVPSTGLPRSLHQDDPVLNQFNIQPLENRPQPLPHVLDVRQDQLQQITPDIPAVVVDLELPEETSVENQSAITGEQTDVIINNPSSDDLGTVLLVVASANRADYLKKCLSFVVKYHPG